MRGKLPEDFTATDRRNVHAALAQVDRLASDLEDCCELADCPLTADEAKLVGLIEESFGTLANALRRKLSGAPA